MIVKFILVCCVRMTLSKGHSPRALKWCFGKTTLVLVLAALALPACAKFSQDPETLADLSSGSGGSGGGSGDSGGDGDADDDGENYVDEYGADYALGTPSIRAAVSDKLFLGSKRNQPYVAPGGTSYDSLFAAHTALNTTSNLPIASRDTNVTAQWDAGWTGKGVKIGIIDDFSDNNTIDSHGDKVSLVVNSVAPEADMLTRHSNLISTDVEAGWADMSTNGYHIVNNSFGRARVSHITQQTDANFDGDVTSWVNNRFKITGLSTYDEDMLFIFAAGNSGDYCPDRRIHACTFRAAVLHGQRAAGETDQEAYIWVGSLTDDGTGLTSYSHSAGEMMNDFIVAHDDVLAKGDGAGTSYAAPRVAGAAAIVRHKFPNLDGMQLKALLLHTAEDMGETGPDEVFGHGKLDLQNTLSPQGMLSSSLSDRNVRSRDRGGDSTRPEAIGGDRFSLPDTAHPATQNTESDEALAVSLAALTLLSKPLAASDIKLVDLSVRPHHAASRVWQGQFTGLNGAAYNARHLYHSRKPEFSGSAIWSKPYGPRLSMLLPLTFDAGYEAALLRTTPLAGIGIGAALALGQSTMVSMRMDNLLRFGGDISETPCYDAFQRGFHCGSGQAWTDYTNGANAKVDLRGALGVAAFQARLLHRF